MEPTGLEAVFLTNRAALLGFLRAHGAVEDAEDVLHELWLRVRAAPTRPIAAPLAYLYRAANNLMLDRNRAARQASVRDTAWTELAQFDHAAPDVERLIIARGEIAAVADALAELPSRAASDVLTRGVRSAGIRGHAVGSIGEGPYGPVALGTVSIAVGRVATAGRAATGIDAVADPGVASVTAGTVSTRGADARGISVETTPGGAITYNLLSGGPSPPGCASAAFGPVGAARCQR